MVVTKGSGISVKLTGFDLATSKKKQSVQDAKKERTSKSSSFVHDCIPEKYNFNLMPLWYLAKCLKIELPKIRDVPFWNSPFEVKLLWLD